MSFTFRPLGARVLVKREPLPEQTRSGLYLLGRDYPTIGRIVSVGNGPRTRTPYHRNCGGKVIFQPQNDEWGKWSLPMCLVCGLGPITDSNMVYRRSLGLLPGQWVQWTTGFDFDLCSIFPTEPDLLLLDYDQINWVGTP
jgi:co-chaperonin GroES (HSP10)